MTAAGACDTRTSGADAFIKRQTGKRRIALALAAGSLSVLAFSPVFASPVLFLTFPVLVWLIDSAADWRGAAKDGWWFGLGYFFFNMFWIGEAFLVEAEKFAILLPLAVTLLPAGLALFWAAAAALAKRFWRAGFARVCLLAVSLAIFEWVRGHVLTGLPWNVPGYALTYPIELMQSAALAGVYALTVPAIVIFSAPLVLWCDDRVRPAAAKGVLSAASAVLPLGAMWAYGALTLAAEPPQFVPGVMMRIVQPSVPQREKWMPEFQRRIFADHLTLSRQAPDGTVDDLKPITHVIWPEAAMPFLPLEHPEALEAIAELLPPGRVLITGAIRREITDASGAELPIAARKAFNGLMAFDDAGNLVALYDKIHLVPFGEYLPLSRVLGAIGLSQLAHSYGAFTAGVTPRPILRIPGLPPALALICYEALFPGQIVQTSERPGVLFNVTNDGWFGDTTGPRQHYHQVRVRAVEEGLPLIRAANNGISAVIDGHGRVLQELPLDVRGVADSRLPVALAPTPYSRTGDFLFAMLCVIMLLGLGLDRRG